jgi:hypothetical protein
MSASASRRRDARLRGSVSDYLLNDLLNLSEAVLVKKIGRSAVTRLVKAFKAEAATKPELWEQLYKAPHPYEWLYERSKRSALH